MPEEKSRILSQLQPAASRRTAHRRLLGAAFGIGMGGMVAALAVAPASFPDDSLPAAIAEPLDTGLAAVLAPAATRYVREEQVRSSDTVASLLSRLGIDDPAAIAFIRSDPSMRSVSRQLRPGQAILAITDDQGRLVQLRISAKGGQEASINVTRTTAGSRYAIAEEVAPAEREIRLRSGEIRTSLFAATDSVGIPDAVATQLAEIFAGDIDFHRDLRQGDRFSVSYEVIRVQGRAVRSGQILSAQFVTGGKTFNAIHFSHPDGSSGYYDLQGKSLRKAFLRSPLEFSRVTSGFSTSRFHPVLREWRAHRGVDYGAPIGTRVRATGDGIVEQMGFQGGYGNLVVLRHAGGYSTAYGHLSAFAAALRKGSRIRQGDPIGYVGKTGLASGPHLHYEFRVRDQQVNPLAIGLPDAPPLDAGSLREFMPIAKVATGHLELARNVGEASQD